MTTASGCSISCPGRVPSTTSGTRASRSEEHTSELQSQFHLVCRLLLEKKKKKKKNQKKKKKKKTKKKQKTKLQKRTQTNHKQPIRQRHCPKHKTYIDKDTKHDEIY